MERSRAAVVSSKPQQPTAPEYAGGIRAMRTATRGKAFAGICGCRFKIPVK
ncbi:MAG: hypothetical protein ACI399_00765 [Candidatus Cryptobacteroides sp.]